MDSHTDGLPVGHNEKSKGSIHPTSYGVVKQTNCACKAGRVVPRIHSQTTLCSGVRRTERRHSRHTIEFFTLCSNRSCCSAMAKAAEWTFW